MTLHHCVTWSFSDLGSYGIGYVINRSKNDSSYERGDETTHPLYETYVNVEGHVGNTTPFLFYS